MKIKKIIADNFKGYDKLIFEPKKVTYAIVGPNGAGKTTTQQAIRYALTGDLPDEPVKKGEDQLEVNTLLWNGTDFTRTKSNTKPSKIRLNGKTTTGKMLQEYLETNTGVPMDGIKLSSSAELIENLKPEEFGNFIMNYVPEDLDIDIIKDYMGVVDPSVIELLEVYMPKEKKFGYEQLSETYAQIFDYRKKCKQELEERNARLNAFKGEKPAQTMSEVNAALEDIMKKEGEIDGIKMAIVSYNKAVEAQKLQLHHIAEIEKQIAMNTSTRPSPTKMKEIKEKKQQLQDEIVSLMSVRNSMVENIEVFQSTLDNLNKPLCPLSERLCCTTDKTALKEEFEDSIVATKEGIVMQDELIAKKKAEIAVLVQEEADFNKNAINYNTKVTLSSQLEKRKKELITLPDKPTSELPDTSAIEETKRNLYSIRDRLIQWTQHEKDEDEAAIYAKKWKVADILVGLLRPNGIVTTKITSYYFDVFQDCCNETIKKINPDYEIKFVAEKGVRIEFKKSGTEFVPYNCASSGERACVIFALMDLISSELTKLNIMVLDDLDKLDKDTFDSLISYIMNADVQKKYDHIIICAVNHSETVSTLKSYPEIDLHEI